jgi:hypothetical protein
VTPTSIHSVRGPAESETRREPCCIALELSIEGVSNGPHPGPLSIGGRHTAMFPDRSLLTAAKPTPPITSVIHTKLASRSPWRTRVTQTKERDQGSSGLKKLDRSDGIAIGGINWHLLKGPLDGGEPGARGVNLVGARHDESAKEQWELNVVQERREQQRGRPAHYILRRGMSTAVPSLTAASHASLQAN